MLTIRKANKNDVLDIASIHFESWGAGYAALLPKSYIDKENNLTLKTEMWQKLISHPDVKIWIAYDDYNANNSKDNQKAVGFISYFTKGNDYEITTLYVLPKYHNLGIGGQLMIIAIREILKSSDSFDDDINLSLWVLKSNLSAIEFYKKRGFIASGESNETLFEGIRIIDIRMINVLEN